MINIIIYKMINKIADIIMYIIIYNIINNIKKITLYKITYIRQNIID